MKIIVGKKIVEEEWRRNHYFVEVNIMHGDADAYTDREFGPFEVNKHEDHLYDFLKVLSRMENHFPNGMSGMDDYKDLQGFLPWFEEETVEGRNEEENESLRLAQDLELYFWWPSDVTSSEGQAQYENHSVWYVDDKGYKRHVTVSE